MRPYVSRRSLLAATIMGALALLGPAQAQGVSCKPVENPYAGTRYEGVDLTKIRAKGVACPKARRVAERAHRKALAAVPSPNGILNLTWNGWSVKGDLRPSNDRYVAARADRRVRWVF